MQNIRPRRKVKSGVSLTLLCTLSWEEANKITVSKKKKKKVNYSNLESASRSICLLTSDGSGWTWITINCVCEWQTPSQINPSDKLFIHQRLHLWKSHASSLSKQWTRPRGPELFNPPDSRSFRVFKPHCRWIVYGIYSTVERRETITSRCLNLSRFCNHKRS